MPMTVEQLVHEAATLPQTEQTHLIERLVTEFGRPGAMRSDDEQREMIRRRVEEIRSGTVRTIAGDEVFAELDVLLGK